MATLRTDDAKQREPGLAKKRLVLKIISVRQVELSNLLEHNKIAKLLIHIDCWFFVEIL